MPPETPGGTLRHAVTLPQGATHTDGRDSAFDARSDEAREHERRAAVILDGMSQFVALLNPQGDILEVNRAALEGAGHRIEEIRGQPFWTARWWQVSAQSQQDLQSAIKRAAAGEFVRYEVDIYGEQSGALPITIDFSLQPIRGASGEVEYLLPEGRNITERKRLQDVPQQTAAMYAQLAAIVDASEDAIIGQTLTGVITSWNQGAERLYGYTAAEALGQPITLLVPPDWPDEIPQLLVRLQRGERVEHYETQRIRKDGRRLDVSLTLSPIRDRTGRIVGASKSARDITARKQAEAELEHRRQETMLLAELAQGLSASLDLETVLQRVVTGAQTLCGSERAFLALREPGTDTLVGGYEVGAPQRAYTDLRIVPGQGLGGQVLLTGRPWRTEDYAADPRFSKELLARARAGGHLAVLAVPIVIAARVEGLLYASNPARQPFTDRDEAILVRLAAHAALAIRNARLYQQAQAEIAQRQRAEAALAQAASALEQRVAERTAALHQAMAERQRLEQEAQRVQHFALLGRLAAGVSHEIRNPLGAVFLHVDVLAEELSDQAPESAALVADTLAEIRTQLARLDDLVQDYLSLVRVAQIERTPENLGAALRAWTPEWQALATTRGVTCQLDGLDDLGVVAVHATTLRRALLNLVQNALDAMPQGGTLTLQGRRAGTTVQLDVRDTGCGIPLDQHAHIFEPLYTTKVGGTGLGLYIVQEVVTAHGGQVAVQSVVGQGSTLTITLPLQDSREAP